MPSGGETDRSSRWWANCVTCSGYLLVVLVIGAMLMPTHPFGQPHQEIARRTACRSNLKQLTMSLEVYAEDHDDRLPPAGNWTPAVRPYLPKYSDGSVETRFHCPVYPIAERTYSYALHAPLGSARIISLEQPEATVLLFDSDLHRPSASGGIEAIATPPRHPLKDQFGCSRPPKGNNYAFLDGHTKWLERPPSFEIHLTPRSRPGSRRLKSRATNGTKSACADSS